LTYAPSNLLNKTARHCAGGPRFPFDNNASARSPGGAPIIRPIEIRGASRHGSEANDAYPEASIGRSSQPEETRDIEPRWVSLLRVGLAVVPNVRVARLHSFCPNRKFARTV